MANQNHPEYAALTKEWNMLIEKLGDQPLYPSNQ